MKQEIIYIEGIKICVYRKDVKNINVKINRNLEVTVSANKRVSMNKVEAFLSLKKDWLNKNLIKMERYKEKKQRQELTNYTTGSTIILMGKKYMLNFVSANLNKVEINMDFIDIYLKTEKDKMNIEKRKKALDKFILSLATQIFEDSLNKILKQINDRYIIPKPKLVIRKMKSRWGTCNKGRKKITINHELIKTPKECLEYVILHELIHFIVSGHNKRFYGVLESFMPDWKIRKKMLKETYVI